MKKLHHIGIAVKNIDSAVNFYRDQLDLKLASIDDHELQRVKRAFLPVGDTMIELLEPLSESSPVAKFLEKRGEGIHHLCFEVNDLDKIIKKFRLNSIPLINNEPFILDSEKRAIFVHPKGTFGVLLELVEKIARD